MKTYLVGGAVRDALLGISGSDRDWVVVGATPEEMLAKGFTPVGRDFPVFLHPDTREALCELLAFKLAARRNDARETARIRANPYTKGVILSAIEFEAKEGVPGVIRS